MGGNGGQPKALTTPRLKDTSGRILIPSDPPRKTDKEKMFPAGGSARRVPSSVHVEGKRPSVTTGGKDQTAGVTRDGPDDNGGLSRL